MNHYRTLRVRTALRSRPADIFWAAPDVSGGPSSHIRFAFFVPFVIAFIAAEMVAEVNLAWWLAWTSNPVEVHRKVGLVGSIPMHLRHFVFRGLRLFQVTCEGQSGYEICN
jgi:hypothetical protein